MSEKSLLSLREIAHELHLKYKTILNLKNQLGPFLPGMFDGRSYKYYPDCIELFRLIYALREEGYTFVMIREIFLQKQGVGNDSELGEWVHEWVNRYGEYWLEQASIDQHVPAQTSVDQHKLEYASVDQHKLECTSTDQPEPGYAGANQPEPACSSVDLELMKEELLSQVAPKLNSTITKFYQTIIQLQQAVTEINQRLARLENELNGEAGPEPQFTELDLEELQVMVENPPAPTRYQHASLEFVKASIQNGKPDRDAVIQWILAEKEKDSQVSYGHLAKALDEAQVPTLSGKTGWCRTTLRNIMVKHK